MACATREHRLHEGLRNFGIHSAFPLRFRLHAPCQHLGAVLPKHKSPCTSSIDTVKEMTRDGYVEYVVAHEQIFAVPWHQHILQLADSIALMFAPRAIVSKPVVDVA